MSQPTVKRIKKMGSRAFFIRHQEIDKSTRPLRHTEAGLEKIRGITIPDIENVMTIICAAGAAFLEILDVIQKELIIPNFTYTAVSPFLGVHNYLDGKYLLDDSRLIDPADYVGIKDERFFDPWRFTESFGKNAIFIGGGEFFNALGLDASCGKGKHLLYELFIESRTGEVLQ